MDRDSFLMGFALGFAVQGRRAKLGSSSGTESGYGLLNFAFVDSSRTLTLQYGETSTTELYRYTEQLKIFSGSVRDHD